MTNVFAPRTYEAFEDEFDLDVEVAPEPSPREPLQFTTPAGAPAPAGGAVTSSAESIASVFMSACIDVRAAGPCQ